MNDLKKLGLKHYTDKAHAHNYTEIYSDIFKNIRNDKIRILEIGAGETGASHKMWKDYFLNGEIFCIDPFHLVDQEKSLQKKLENYGIKVFKGNQLSKEDLHNFIKCFGDDFDIILDDGAHMPDAIQTSLGVLFPFLKSKGFYIIEDLATVKSRQQRIELVNKNIEGILNIPHVVDYNLEENFINYKNSGMWNSSMLNKAEKEYLENNILTWKFYDDGFDLKNMCIIRKK